MGTTLPGAAVRDLPAHLSRLAAGAPQRSPNVPALAKFAANTRCNVASLAFAARVDLDRVLEGTALEVPFGQSPFAFRWGNVLEERLRADVYKPVLSLLQQHLDSDVGAARVASVRMKPPFSHARWRTAHVRPSRWSRRW